MCDIYTCEECGKQQEVSISLVEEKNDEETLLDKLNEEGESYGPHGYNYGYPANPVSAEMTAYVPCIRCGEDIAVGISVEVTPEWDDSRENGDPRIDHYYDFVIEDVLPQTSAFSTHIDPDSFYSAHAYDDFDDYPDITDTEEQDSAPENIDLLIIAKTRMNAGFCHLGFNTDTYKIYRPLYRPSEGQCCWDTELNMDSMYLFKALRFPNDGIVPFTPSPHNNEDLLVKPDAIPQATAVNANELFENLASIAKHSVKEIFEGLQENKFVYEGVDIPSVGVLKCPEKNVRSYENNLGKRRIEIEDYDFPYTGLGGVPDIDQIRPCLVILGLGRPWGGNPDGSCSPKRCYVLALRVLQL